MPVTCACINQCQTDDPDQKHTIHDNGPCVCERHVWTVNIPSKEQFNQNNQREENKSFGTPIMTPLNVKIKDEPGVQELIISETNNVIIKVEPAEPIKLEVVEQTTNNTIPNENNYVTTNTVIRQCESSEQVIPAEQLNKTAKLITDTKPKTIQPLTEESTEQIKVEPAELIINDIDGSYAETYDSNTNTGNRYKCDMCDMWFDQINNFNSHKSVHFKIKNFQCNICEKFFTSKQILNKHKFIHTGEKPFKCDMCDQSFLRGFNLNRHINTAHLQIKPYKCDICSKSFCVKNTLTTHQLIHTGQKDFQCDMCYKLFAQRSTLNRHTKSCMKHVNKHSNFEFSHFL